ncbi:MAG: cell shape determination protein CcmA [Bacteroidetes bacterium]|nr:MAG: cell shape determination protein CcmA [Bacteroidota bacterium]
MFAAKSKSEIESPSASGTSLIGAGTVIKGDISSNGDIRIDGVLKGNVKSTAKVLIGPDGVVEGDIEGQQADILGKVSGKIQIKELLNLRGKASIKGNISAGKLQIEPTVTFNGQCHMGNEASVVEMISEEEEHAIAQ